MLHRLFHIMRSARLTSALLLAVACMGLTGGAPIDQGPAMLRIAADASATDPMTMPASSSAFERVASALAESVELSDAQDDPAPSLDVVPVHPGRRKQPHALSAIAFTSALPTRSERPPIRSFLQS